MRSLYFRVWLTVVAVLAVFAFFSGWLFQRHVEQERMRIDAVAASDRITAWAELIQRALPPADAAAAAQAAALVDWSARLRVPLALDDMTGQRIAESEAFSRRWESGPGRALPVRLDDGRTLWVMRPPIRPGMGPRMGTGTPAMPMSIGEGSPGARVEASSNGGPPGLSARAERMREPRSGGLAVPPWGPPVQGFGLVIVLVLLFVAIALGAFPVVRRLTRRLEALQQGVERFGAGALSQRVDDSGRDEVAAVASSFNRAAERIETLVRSHQVLLANASHELRSPLARLKMAAAMFGDAGPEQRARLQREIDANIGELDALVEEVLLASRLDAGVASRADDPVELPALAAEEAAHFDVTVSAPAGVARVRGDDRLLRRAVRNLLENAQRYGGGEIGLALAQRGAQVELRVCDRGSGVPQDMRERIFEPFFRLPGHAEREGGVGLGLSLVRQIAHSHGGSVRCEPREGGGSCFVLSLPALA